MPTLVVVTAEDPLVAPAVPRALGFARAGRYPQRALAAVPGARSVELATGHLPFWEDPKGWADVVEDFLTAGTS
ncbi:hypothetical protein [Streptomyces sp. CC208A]|uniref:alpha/beta fold hydrolase n=1 Tax=Streptomyces sp. CC208A TaxID=3044573 RepID=UPI0024A8654C|nr:hypothetical protein [Streptomyces sp. CC208A]